MTMSSHLKENTGDVFLVVRQYGNVLCLPVRSRYGCKVVQPLAVDEARS